MSGVKQPSFMLWARGERGVRDYLRVDDLGKMFAHGGGELGQRGARSMGGRGGRGQYGAEPSGYTTVLPVLDGCEWTRLFFDADDRIVHDDADRAPGVTIRTGDLTGGGVI